MDFTQGITMIVYYEDTQGWTSPTLPPNESSLHGDENCEQSGNTGCCKESNEIPDCQRNCTSYRRHGQRRSALLPQGHRDTGLWRGPATTNRHITTSHARMGLLSILKKVKQKEKEVRLLIL